jgi:hypothetical protein
MATVKLYKKDTGIYYKNGSVEIYADGGRVCLQLASATEVYLTIYVEHGYNTKKLTNAVIPITDIVDRFDVQYGTTIEQLIFGYNKGIDTKLIDSSTDSVFQKFNKVNNGTTLASEVAGDLGAGRVIEVTNATGISVGSHIILFHPDSVRFTTFTAIGVSGTTITLDSLIDFKYPAGTFVDIGITNMAVDGSVTPVVFGLRGTGIPPGISLTYHMTRMIFSCLTDSAVSLAEFGDIPALEKGLLFRTRNGRFHNEWNVKTNGDLLGILYDWSPFAATNPIQGQDGFGARLTYGSPGKVGVVLALPLGMDAEIVVQDDLRAITLLEIMSEGHIIAPFPLAA